MTVSLDQINNELQRRGVDIPSSTTPPSTIPPMSAISKLVQTPEVQTILGASDEAQRQLAALLGIKPPEALAEPSGIAPKAGAAIQNIASFLAASELGGVPLEAASRIPELAKAAKVLKGATGRIVGTTAFGAATDPNRLKGALLGAAYSTGGELLPVVGRAIQKLSPQFLTDTIMNYLKGGRTIEENNKSLAGDIKNSYEQKQDEGAALYNPFFKKVGAKNIYAKNINSPEFYTNMDQNVFDSYLPDMKNLHDKFMENPTIQNAHDLQSQLGFEVRKLEKNPNKSVADTGSMQNWRQARNNLREDVGTFLDLKDKTGELSHQYDNATNFFRDNVAPYKSNRAISKMATGIVTNPKNINTLFRFPSEDMQQIVEDIGDEGKKKILFSELGKKPKMTPQQLNSEINKLETKGLSSYITPTLQEQIDKLPGKITAAEALQRTAGLASGILLGHGGGMAGETLAGVGGATLSPYVLRTLSKLVPRRTIARIFPTLRSIITGAALGPSSPPSEITPTQSNLTLSQINSELKRRGLSQ